MDDVAAAPPNEISDAEAIVRSLRVSNEIFRRLNEMALDPLHRGVLLRHISELSEIETRVQLLLSFLLTR
jgi:uncharacterized protein YfeS